MTEEIKDTITIGDVECRNYIKIDVGWVVETPEGNLYLIESDSVIHEQKTAYYQSANPSHKDEWEKIGSSMQFGRDNTHKWFIQTIADHMAKGQTDGNK